MPRLSILIPFLGDRDSLENTLASVLQNRPEGAEIVVALSQDYEDPYQLGEEVHFIRVEPEASLVATLNQGFVACQAPIIHTLACGVTVGEGWADHARARFNDRRVASVAPLALQADDPERVWAAGLEYRPSGVVRRRGHGLLAESAAQLGGDLAGSDLAGPSLAAGFYRRAALGGVSPVFDPVLGPNFSDVDLALRLLAAGYTNVCEPSSLVFQPRLAAHSIDGWAQARQAERMFWRHGSRHGWLHSLAAHLASVSGEFAGNLPRAKALVQLAGRCLAGCEWGSARRRSLQLALPRFAAPSEMIDAKQSGPDGPGRRLDRPHFELEARPGRAESRRQRTPLPSVNDRPSS
ncbi:MAG TPA: hypothetical protein VMV10_20060 [Pirellulales bacterium]|nr:hypothetical protein [Pirellulales bacterium]